MLTMESSEVYYRLTSVVLFLKPLNRLFIFEGLCSFLDIFDPDESSSTIAYLPAL